ncbi:MAG TPA: agmatinase [Vicinamibacterales bacterium]
MRPAPQLLGVPYDASSSFLRGAAAAPPLIRAALRSPAGNNFTERGADLEQLADGGDLALAEDAATARAQIHAGIEQVLTSGFAPIALGGDHSITYPILRAIAKQHRSLTILHIDAHGDLYDEFEGDRFSHACPFARIMEEGLCERLVQVGIRTLTPHQRDQIRKFNVDAIEMQHFAGGARPSVSGPVYISLDIDGIDPAFAPGVSHREPGGLSVRDVIAMIHALGGLIVGADLVEFNPAQDLGNVTASVAAKLVREIAGSMLLSR